MRPTGSPPTSISKYTFGLAKRLLEPEKALVAYLVADREAVNAVAGARSVAASIAIFIVIPDL
jgi:hypothetical protein